MESIVGSFRGVASDKRLCCVCGYPQRVMCLVSVFVDMAFCLGYRNGLYSHNLIHRSAVSIKEYFSISDISEGMKKII